MSVPEQMPIVEYTANGTTTRFPITFNLHDVRYLNVFINKELAPVGSYTVDNFEAVVFTTAPNENYEITLIRDTQLDRETNYQSFDNSFRPAAVNYDFDKIWHVLQEQNLIDGKLLARLKDEIEWRRTHDANFDELSKMRDAQIFSGLKQYLDTIVASVTPNIFGGVTAGIVFAIDGKSVQTHLEDILSQLTSGHESVIQEKERAELAESTLDQKINQTEILLSADITAEKQRAMNVESGLQSQINGIGGGNYAYLTYAAMTADTVNIPAKSSVTVTNDSDATKNGIYQYSGTAFTKSTYDPENTLKTWANQNPLFKVKSLTVNDNLNDIKTSGKYKCELSATASTAKNYPFLAAGTLEVVEINATAFFQVYKAYGTFGTAIRTTASDGSWLSWNTYALQADVASQILAAKNAKNLATNLDMNLNDLTEQGVVSVYSDKDITVSNFPEKTQGFLYNYRVGSVYSQLFLSRGSNNMYVRAYWGSNGWTAWDRLVLASEMTKLKDDLVLSIDTKVDPLNAFRKSLFTKLDGLDSVRLKLVGDSITWGANASNGSSPLPRDKTMNDARNTTSPISPSWANLFRQYIAHSFGDTSITEDRPGSAYTKRKKNISIKDHIKKFSFKTASGIAVSETVALQGISDNTSASNGEVMNLLGANFVSSRQNEFSFDITSDNLSILYAKWATGDAENICEVYVDDLKYGEFNYYSTSTVYDNEFKVTFPYGKHKIRVKNIATNSASYALIQCCATEQKVWVINEGINGSFTNDWITRGLMAATVNTYDDFVLMQLGTNDRGTRGVAGFKSRLKTCVDLINSLSNNNAKILLLTSVPDSTSNSLNPAYHYNMQTVDAVITSVATELNLAHISQYKHTIQYVIDGVNIWADGLHPNDFGYKLMYQNLRNQLFKV